MKLEEWDKRIAPRLNKIQGVCGWLMYYCRELQMALEGLDARPAWETLAKEYLDRAETDCLVTLSTIRATRDLYDNLPVLVESHTEEHFTSRAAE